MSQMSLEPVADVPPQRPRKNDDTIYTVLLGVVAFFMLLRTIEIAFMAYRPGVDANQTWVLG